MIHSPSSVSGQERGRASAAQDYRMVITNAMTVDVEDYFQVSAFEGHISRDDWATLPCRVERNCDRILALFDERDIKAHFFHRSVDH